MKNIANRKTYTLTLSDERSWRFSAAESLQGWLNSFAGILQLESSSNQNADTQIIFTKYKQNETPPCENHKWELFKSGSISRAWWHSDISEIFIEINHEFIEHQDIRVINMWNSLKPLFRYYTENDGGPVHAAFAGLNDNGFLIAAPGDTGKSTSLARLPGYYEKLSDDMALIVKANGNYRAHPMPTWSDHLCRGLKSTFKVRQSLPLKAIFFLEQAEIDEVITIEPVKASSEIFASFKQVWSPYWHRMNDEARKQRQLQAFDNSVHLAKSIPCYKLRSTLHDRFWEKIEKTL